MLLSTVAGMQTGTSRPYLPRASIRFRPPTCLEISVSLLLAPPMVPEIWQVALPTVGYATASCACTHTIEGTPARLYTCLASVNRSRNNANVLATPGCPWWQCIRASRSDTRQLGIASTDVSYQCSASLHLKPQEALIVYKVPVDNFLRQTIRTRYFPLAKQRLPDSV